MGIPYTNIVMFEQEYVDRTQLNVAMLFPNWMDTFMFCVPTDDVASDIYANNVLGTSSIQYVIE